MRIKLLGALLILVGPLTSEAALKVITTIPDLRELVREVGGDRVEVESIAKGTQDPHYLEAKPSYMVKSRVPIW